MTDDNGGGCCANEPGSEGEEYALELGTAGQFILEMRAQNLELLKLAAQIAGYSGAHGPLKPNDVRQALRGVWDVYSELYAWVDPEDDQDDEDGADEESE